MITGGDLIRPGEATGTIEVYNNTNNVIDVVLTRWGSSRGRIAALSRIVVAADAEGDAVAADILDRAAVQLVELVTATSDARNGHESLG